MNTRSVLLLCRCAPYGSARARDALDAAMAFGAFEQRIALLLMGDAVLMLLPPDERGGPLPRLAGTLPDYGIERVFVERDALLVRGLASRPLALPVEPLADEQIAALIAAHDVVLTV